ncbi:hypothetical protein [Actinoplanes aureus]|uniref:Uncharacterized protein n=1 Tax=Actinoplanes aureus TaxID=2792083 RepID=A0A931CHA9_9ACTN|nr:hypothetical protein [Actinoplanes aureus]MBG0567263.1 hypothetical protein [Actinoplanes aureus]
MDLQARADRRFRIVLIVFGLLIPLALAAGFLAAGPGREPRTWLIVLAVLIGLIALCGLGLTLMVRAVRRRTGTMVSPLWGADRKTRAQVGQAIKNQEKPDGEIGRLALAEAQRGVKLAPIVLPLATLAAVFPLINVGLLLGDGDASPGRVAVHAVQAAGFAGLAIYHAILRRRSRAYLNRFQGYA